MHLEGKVTIAATQAKAWEFLTDPEAVGQCAPGLQSMNIVEPNKKFKAVAGVGLGTVKVTFNADVEFVELTAPNNAKLKVHGVAPGSSMDATSEMKLTALSDKETQLDWTADVVVVGKIATLASRLMGGVTQQLAGEFFKCVKSKIEQ
jgi:carbon monoxide dehydrogenase subunit G